MISVLRRVVGDEHPTKIIPGSLPNRFFALSQKSYWIPRGADSTVVPVVDTVVILGPDTTGGDAVRFSSGQGCCEGTLFLERDSSARTVRIRVADNWHDPESQSGALLLEAGAWRQTIGLHDTGAWRDSVVIRHRSNVSDSIRQVSVRQGRALAWVSYAGARWLRMRATRTVELTGRSTIEKTLSTTGTPVDVRCFGTIAEEFLYEPATGFVDSLLARGTLQGRIAYHEATGRVDTVDGTWRMERRGSWHYYAQLQSDEVVFDDSDGNVVGAQQRYLGLTDHALYPDSDFVERVFQWRSEAQSPAERWPLDQIVGQVSHNRDVGSFVTDRAFRQYRAGDRALVDILLPRYGGTESALRQNLVEALAKQLASLAIERRAQTDREALFDNLNSVLHEAGGVEAGAGEPAARAVQSTDDPHARDLLLLVAYESDPAKYLPLLERLAGTRAGTYGGIARAYAAGNLGAAFYGPKPEAYEVTWTGRPFPGIDHPWREHVRYFENLPDGAALKRAQSPKEGADWLGRPGSSLDDPDYPAMGRAVNLLLRARGMDPAAVLRGRFDAERDSNGRLVWAHYLLAMRDTTPLPWVRGAYRDAGGKLAADAFRLLELHAEGVGRGVVADTVKGGGTLVAVQDAVLSCLTGAVALVDTAGKPDGACSPDGDLPKKLQSDGLAPQTIEKWRSRFAIRSHDDFIRSARQRPRWLLGRDMAVILSPVRRIENRYFIDYAIVPGSGESCLCGSGGSLVLEQRKDRWVVVRSGGWIS